MRKLKWAKELLETSITIKALIEMRDREQREKNCTACKDMVELAIGTAKIKIKVLYCPMCGRKMEEKENDV